MNNKFQNTCHYKLPTEVFKFAVSKTKLTPGVAAVDDLSQLANNTVFKNIVSIDAVLISPSRTRCGKWTKKCH